eukprot:8726019-Alexandrium_andersonii.AAC.1
MQPADRDELDSMLADLSSSGAAGSSDTSSKNRTLQPQPSIDDSGYPSMLDDSWKDMDSDDCSDHLLT